MGVTTPAARNGKRSKDPRFPTTEQAAHVLMASGLFRGKLVEVESEEAFAQQYLESVREAEAAKAAKAVTDGG